MALVDDPASRDVCLLDGDRVVGLGGAVVLHEHQRGVRPDCQLAHEAIVGTGVAQHPAVAVHVEDSRKRSGRAERLDDADRDVADLRRDGDPALVDVGLGDRRGLDVVEDLAGAVPVGDDPAHPRSTSAATRPHRSLAPVGGLEVPSPAIRARNAASSAAIFRASASTLSTSPSGMTTAPAASAYTY